MEMGGLDRALHVVDGDFHAGTLRWALSLAREQILVNEDKLSIGPAPATEDLCEWRATRERFFRDLYRHQWPDFSFDEYADNGLLMNAPRLAQEMQVVVWVALGLPEQLLLSRVVFLFDRLGLDPARLRVIQFERTRSGHPVEAIAVLSVEDIRQVCPAPSRLRDDEIDALRRAWIAYTSSDPAILSRYLAEPSPRVILHEAMNQLVYRYPDTRSGLGAHEERLLDFVVKNGPDVVRVIGYALGYNETPDQVGDDYLFRRLLDLRRDELASPLVSITGDTRTMSGCEVELTPFGHEVLAGRANHVRENGIDDWIGGVHLVTGDPITFRDGDALILPDPA